MPLCVQIHSGGSQVYNVIVEIKKRVSIEHIATLNRQADRDRVRCPVPGCCGILKVFNDEHFECMKCGTHGDVITFVQLQESCNMNEAISLLVDRAGANVPSTARWPVNISTHYDDMLNYAQLYFFSQITERRYRANELIKKAGLADEAIHYYQIGFSPNEERGLTEHLIDGGYDLDRAVSLGILTLAKKEYSDAYRNVLVVPVLSEIGKIERFIPISDKNEQEKISIDQVVFGLYQARKYIHGTRTVIITSNFFGIVSLYNAGIRNSLYATKITNDQAVLISECADTALFAMPTGATGNMNINANMETLKRFGVSCRKIHSS